MLNLESYIQPSREHLTCHMNYPAPKTPILQENTPWEPIFYYFKKENYNTLHINPNPH